MGFFLTDLRVFECWLTSPKALLPLKHTLSFFINAILLVGKSSRVAESDSSLCHIENTPRLDIGFFSKILTWKQRFPCAIMQILC